MAEDLDVEPCGRGDCDCCSCWWRREAALRAEVERLRVNLQIALDQLDAEQKTSKSCDSCGLLWPNHEIQCGLWAARAEVTSLRSSCSSLQSEVSSLRSEVERLKEDIEVKDIVLQSAGDELQRDRERERRYLEALEKIRAQARKGVCPADLLMIERACDSALSPAPGSQTVDRLHKEMIEDFLKAHSKEELDAMVKEAHVAVHGFRASDTSEVASDSQEADHIPDVAEKDREATIRECAEIVDQLGQPKAQRKSTAQLLDYIKRWILSLLSKKDEGRVG